jgi:hypothetical protein
MVQDAIRLVPEFKAYVELWQRLGRRIRTVDDLFLCYYSSLTVIRVPDKDHLMRMNSQVDELHNQITQRCQEGFTAKVKARMNSNADELQSYLSAGFEHFTTKLDRPFNFIEIALRNNPIPQDFADHITSLAALLQEHKPLRGGFAQFRRLTSIIASCILLDCVRHNRPATREGNDLELDLFLMLTLLGSSRGLFRKFYVPFCEAAFAQISDRCLPCSFMKGGKVCVNVRSNHSKGHQDSNGKIIAVGNFLEDFAEEDVSCSKWIDELEQDLCSAEERLEKTRSNLNNTEKMAILEYHNALERHVEFLEGFYAEFNMAAGHMCLSTCFCCLLEVPQHPLPCGHLLCAACVKDYGKPVNGSATLIEHCPLHLARANGMRPSLVCHKPNFAGTRILSLDG